MADVGVVMSVKRQYLNQLLSKRNVVACGVGFKEKEGRIIEEPCVVVSVAKKVPAAQLSPKDLVPKRLGDVLTDVQEVGIIRAWQSPKDKWRPAPGGVSIGHVNVTAGTLGCLVMREGHLFILSNNHVLAASNNARLGDPIIQPARYDGGTPADQIATLEDFIPLNFGSEEPTCSIAKGTEQIMNAVASALGSSHRVATYRQAPQPNQVDAALARPLSPDLVKAEILGIGVPKGVREATLGTRVQKSGRTTGHTTGMITQIDVTVQVDYDGRTATFTDQLMAGPMSSGGDSGSAVLDEDGYVVGLLFAGSDMATLINPIQLVLDALHIQIVTG